MKTLVLTLVAVSTFAATQVMAQPKLNDENADGVYSYAELSAAYPDVTQATFDGADTDHSGALDADELKLAQEAGAIPS